MPLFICTECGCVDNTATSGYWWRNRESNGAYTPCSECDPEFGKWHGLFPKEPWDGKRIVKNPPEVTSAG